MPMIDLTIPPDTLDELTVAQLVDDLLNALLRWEGTPDNERSRSLAWAFVHVAEVTVASASFDLPLYRVEVTTPQAALDDERRAGLIAEVTELVLLAEGSPVTEHQALRVWVLLHEVAEGSWGAAGRVWRLRDIAGFVLDDPARGEAVAAQRLGH